MQISKLKEKLSTCSTLNQTTEYSIFFILPVASYLLFTFYKHLNSDLYSSYLDNVNFYIHEVGHLVFMVFFNQFILTL